MPTLLEEPATAQTTSAADRLRSTMAAVRVCFTWFGVRKSLNQDQKTQAADAFGAEGDYLSAAKKLLDTSHSAYKAVTNVRGRILSYWRGLTLPYPEPAVRLIRQDDVTTFTVQMTTLRQELHAAVETLNERYTELKSAARRRLGRLFNQSDYPAALTGLFDCTWDWPSIEPPGYLQRLSPQLYQQEAQRVSARFNEAVALAEQAFAEELSKLIGHLTERLSGSEDGKPKIFRDSAVDAFGEFFSRFRYLDVGSSEQLEQVISQAQRIISNVEPQQLRDSGSLRQRISSQLTAVQSHLDGLLVDRPRRNIIRKAR